MLTGNDAGIPEISFFVTMGREVASERVTRPDDAGCQLDMRMSWVDFLIVKDFHGRL